MYIKVKGVNLFILSVSLNGYIIKQILCPIKYSLKNKNITYLPYMILF